MDKAEFEHADPFELWKIILAQRAVRDVNEKRIAVLTQTLMQFLNSEHQWDEFPCPNERGVCTCGLVERNALIRHVLDPSQDLAFYQQDEAHSAARISYEAAWADLQNALLIISRENEKGRTSFQFLEDRARARVNTVLEHNPWLRDETCANCGKLERVPGEELCETCWLATK